ncbi:uncharacterized protein AKAME5_001988900 [Lates japonicus]|uniref:Uncharacterized protein n=1 Tax=Lates japonicus TaxID=270547 RepID=A0AAD3N9B1_LATJO|nr:uncharacterized protein AKAME5_001988900 [Lates japonicus]
MIITAFSITNVLLTLPLSVIVLYLGFRQWRPRCFASTGLSMSRADLFTYSMVAMMLIEVLASCLYCVGTYTNVSVIMSVGYNTFCICSSKKILLEMLTCVERYLAVVHPVTYRGLKNQTGIRIRNLSTGRPGPGDEGRNRERVDHFKRKAFHTILTILGGQLLALGGVMVQIDDGVNNGQVALHAENEDVEREEKEDVDDGEGDEGVLASSGKVTMYVDREVGGGEGRRGEGHIEGGEGVDRHDLWKRTGEWR